MYMHFGFHIFCFRHISHSLYTHNFQAMENVFSENVGFGRRSLAKHLGLCVVALYIKACISVYHGMPCIIMYFKFNFSICNRLPWLVLSFKYQRPMYTVHILYNFQEWWIVANTKSKRKPQKIKNKKNYFRMRIERIYANPSEKR